ncbi:hypothetical protein PUNSTDRAFT_137981 [Punctularia strigosozonata HHB-11173 SS5]|uniref:Coenzyme Q-binding protein COQ10 START domain-containing protein n=1 Tax=Punctularia strigosozonata (strain HHB-11173) TaxID=741275 RepID=R7S5J4_PUNST|nr:uncharacterized protein PUNSTDRAFT_137981 [Punctularia strigosozonata HHB-11173 SS5]EIN05299.1 hypothetical protein PUNSTDRAFT_137981 [Punctularia strigosozonata HHB-11173 SS5]
MSSPTGLPLPPTGGILTVREHVNDNSVSYSWLQISASAVIEASPDRVWETLINLESYSEWNPFVRSADVCNAAKHRLDDQTLSAGKHVLLKVHMPPSMDDTRSSRMTLCEVTHVDHENRRVCWGSHELPKWVLYSDRWQSVIPADPEGRTSKYETREVMYGFLAFIVKLFYTKPLQEGFDAMAKGLKSKSESL